MLHRKSPHSDADTNKYAVAPSGVRFKKDREGVIPSIIKQYYDERRVVKKLMIEKQKNINKHQHSHSRMRFNDWTINRCQSRF